MAPDSNDRIADVVAQEVSRLRRFIRRRLGSSQDVEDIVQDVLARLVEANRRLMPIDHITGWLFRVARNRVTDVLRRRKHERFAEAAGAQEDGELLRLEDLLPSSDANPETLYLRRALFEEFERALDELPREQREVFVWHEFEGRTFDEMAAETGLNLNTLLSRKRYAVMRLRQRLQNTFDEFSKYRGTS
jgi:RNA polymerase sigma factor (sigma-70 family)